MYVSGTVSASLLRLRRLRGRPHCREEARGEAVRSRGGQSAVAEEAYKQARWLDYACMCLFQLAAGDYSGEEAAHFARYVLEQLAGDGDSVARAALEQLRRQKDSEGKS